MEEFGLVTACIITFSVLVMTIVLSVTFVDQRVRLNACRKTYNISSCEIIYVLNTAHELIEKYGGNDVHNE